MAELSFDKWPTIHHVPPQEGDLFYIPRTGVTVQVTHVDEESMSMTVETYTESATDDSANGSTEPESEHVE